MQKSLNNIIDINDIGKSKRLLEKNESSRSRGRPRRAKDRSTRSDDAKTIKIAGNAWEVLRRAKFELDASSYSDAIIFMDDNPGKGPKQASPEVQSKVPEDQVEASRKTIVISKRAYDILRRLKFQYYLESYSDAITHLDKSFRNR
jgi:predicted CopG family antitoxin